AGLSDDRYREAGATVTPDPFAEGADLVLVVGPPSLELIGRIPHGAALLGFIDPFGSRELMDAVTARRITAFAVEAIPRPTPAQRRGALPSQPPAAGSAAVPAAARAASRICPVLTTAAGTIPPVKLLVLGAGVAGLRAIATARRLGAVV